MAQDVVLTEGATADGKVMITPGSDVPIAVTAEATKAPENPGESKPEEDKEKGKEGEKPKPGDKSAADQVEFKILTRGDVKPREKPDAKEFDVRPDAAGMVQFNFRSQPWPEVLDWLATISNMSLDWQELPGDYLNLSMTRPHSVETTRDLINRHLLARGFTLLENDGVLSVVNLKKLNPAFVPRVEPADIHKYQPHSFIKVSFPLSSMVADDTVAELKPLLSPHGVLTALKNTNRVEIIDTALNIQQLSQLLKQEQTPAVQERQVREFTIRHVRAAELREQVMSLLGIEEKKKKGGAMTPEEMAMQQQEMQMQMQMQQQQQQSGGAPPKDNKPQVNLVANIRTNSLLAHAPPDKMAIIEQAVKLLDVPNQTSQEILANANRVQVYRLATLDPDVVVKSLNDLGVLEPATKLQIDQKNKSIVAYASIVDHLTIKALITRLDGSGRKFEVITLRRLPADYVAGTIDFMMAGNKGDEQQPRRRSYFFDYYGDNQKENDQDKDKFRVDADIEHNRLLIWANPLELAEVENLLVKLGEISDRNQINSSMRVINIPAGLDRDQFLRQLQKTWPTVSPNPLQLPQNEPTIIPREVAPPPAPAPKNDQPFNGNPALEPLPTTSTGNPPKPASSTPSSVPAPEVNKTALAIPLKVSPSFTLVGNDRPAVAAESSTSEASAQSDGSLSPHASEAAVSVANRADASSLPQIATPPVKLIWGYDNQLLISSTDPAALDLLEDLMLDLAPPRPDYKIFQLRYASSFWVAKNLQDYFSEKEDDKNNNVRRVYFYDSEENKKTEAQRRLSKRRPLKFIDDLDTNTILVSGADPGQLRIIEELIKAYDKPDPVNSQSARVTTTIRLQYAKAQIVGDAVKDVYRDLLSSNDKALQNGGGQQETKRPPGDTYIFNEGGEGSGEEKRTQVSFKGKLSIGIDEYSNTLLISTEGENLMNAVLKLINSLDEAAKPMQTSMRVVQLGKGMDTDAARLALMRAIQGNNPRRNFGDNEENGSNPGDNQNRGRNGRPDQNQNQQNQGNWGNGEDR
ncbi:MAG: secretin N-terminal domain-containing protein [Pirellulales bacterium]|nr:secretin N-terminal domain-containing protein [Pirellulales bacterium]